MITTAKKVGSLSVWVVDDDPDDHLLFSLAATECETDLTLSFSKSGSELVQQLSGAQDLPEVLVLDLRMPGLDGHQTLELIRSAPGWDDLPIVVFTTSTRASDRDRAMKLGADFVVVKPMQFSSMIEFVDSLAWRSCVRS